MNGRRDNHREPDPRRRADGRSNPASQQREGRPAAGQGRMTAANPSRMSVGNTRRGHAENDQGNRVDRLVRIERRKARNRAITLSILVMLIMLLTVVLIITVMKKAKPGPSLMFIQEGELAHSVQSTGLIIRDEAVFDASSAGILKTLVTEGSRAAKGQKLALIIPEGKESQLVDLQKCENDIINLQTELMNTGKVPGAQAVFDESAAALNAIINLIRSDAAKGNLTNMDAYSTSIAVILEQRTAKLMDIDFNDARLDTLETRKTSLEMSLGLDAGTLICQKPGIVSFRLDGLETELTPAMAGSITAEQYQTYLNSTAKPVSAQPQVSENQPVLRITTNLAQHLVFVLPDTSPDMFKEAALIDINLPDEGLTIKDCQVVRAESSGSGTLLVVRTVLQVDRLDDRRTISATVTVSSTTGLKVPVTALIDYDSETAQAGLMIVSGGYTRQCLVEVVDTDREYAIIKPLDTEQYKPAVSTVLVVNPSSIEAGEFIGN